MENFDAVGRWRDLDNGAPIDTSGVFPDGTKFNGMAGLKKALLAHPEQFVNTATEKLLMYAISRNVAVLRRSRRARHRARRAPKTTTRSNRWCWEL